MYAVLSRHGLQESCLLEGGELGLCLLELDEHVVALQLLGINESFLES